eukprot:gnl/TRDRNA2_/TRDRNA2_198912_c0_seq1.p1 gnl/TRDRNA2_/TRDRNA2_198912_c0~~gnl/TRDRNA2_/TRDRNA2_198912_c0_seq1.p1  ORF type:complete len:179 (+),score=45.43 gnl/TRDRNA2_/TRDRNA2_198912_c0_seq1:36-539(+)
MDPAGASEPAQPAAAGSGKKAKKKRKLSSVQTPVAAGEDAGASARAAGAEIDDIFSMRKSSAASDTAAAAASSSASSGSKTSSGLAAAKRLKGGRTAAPSKGSAEDPLGRGDEWTDDGLGGVYDKDGWTGRRTSGDSLRIFKSHLIKVNAKGSGNTPLCPFDCECCF